MAFSVSEILLLSKTAKFPWNIYSPWSSKNLIDWNQLKNFMQVRIDVTYMHNNFSGCDLSGFGDIATFKNSQIFLLTHGLYIDVTYIHTNFGGCDLSGFGDIATFKNSQIFLLTHGLYSPWSSKNLIA